MPQPISTIARDRIARLRRRIADGSYRIDRRLLAEALAGHDDRPGAPVATPAEVRGAAVAMLQAALTALTPRATMLLQLHFVEQLGSGEAARVMALPERRAVTLWQESLGRLHHIVELS